jgi:hypothetical protein
MEWKINYLLVGPEILTSTFFQSLNKEIVECRLFKNHKKYPQNFKLSFLVEWTIDVLKTD